jgi:hypothetical protein
MEKQRGWSALILGRNEPLAVSSQPQRYTEPWFSLALDELILVQPWPFVTHLSPSLLQASFICGNFPLPLSYDRGASDPLE